ncbi:hypothetical protein KAJ27_16390 [bacterium]|nr:hypothetical protein [bacterium]
MITEEFEIISSISCILPTTNEKIVEHADLFQLIKVGKKDEYQNAMKAHLQPFWEFLYNNNKKI